MVTAGVILGAIVAAIGVLEGLRRLVRWTRRLRANAKRMAEEIHSAGRGAQNLAELAGSITIFAAQLLGRLEHVEHRVDGHEERLDDLSEIVVDNAAELHRLKRERGSPS